LPEREGACIAGEVYRLAATARRLPGEYDDNFHLTATGGEEFTFEGHASGIPSSMCQSQIESVLGRMVESKFDHSGTIGWFPSSGLTSSKLGLILYWVLIPNHAANDQ
jgi:hypothetical protein